MSLFDFVRFAAITDEIKKQEKEAKLEDLERRKSYGYMSDWEYEYEKSQIEDDF